MNKIRKSRASKVIAGFVGFATAVTMSFGTASAATTEELTAQIASLLATITSLQSQLSTMQGGTTTTGGVTYTFSKNLKMGDTGADVMNLQKVLNMNAATQVAATGAGSPGMESTYFGAKTKTAVIKFQEMHMAQILTPVGLTKGTGFVGASTRALLNTMSVGTGTGTVGLPEGCTSTAGFSPVTGASCATGVIVGGGITTGSTVNVTLAADTPVSGTLIAGQAVADLAHFTFTNTTSSEVKVTKLVLNRTGISNDVTLSNVYLYNGALRVTDSASVSSSVITFNDASGIITVPVGGTVTLAVKADIATDTSGQIIGVSLGSVVAGTVTVGGTFPLLGNTHTIATATMATVYWGAADPTPATASIDPQDDYVMWQKTSLNVGTRAVLLKSIMLRQIGSVLAGDLGKFKLYVDGTMVGTEVASLSSNGYVTFDFSASPLKIETGTHTMKMVGNIIGGSNKTFSFSLQNAGDAVFVDSQLNVPVLPAQASGVSFTALNTGTQTVNTGTLTITKSTGSLSGNVTLNGSGIALGKFDVKANGEPLKIESLRISVTTNNAAPTLFSLRNGALFADGVQVGSTASILEDSTGVFYTQFNLGSSLVVMPGTPVVLEVRADVYNDYTGGTAITAGNTLIANIAAGATNNVKKVNSLTYITNTAVSANTLTVATGGLSGNKNQTYANQTVVVPQTAYKIGSFTFVTTDTETINLDTMTLAFSGTMDAPTSVNDVYLKYGTKTSSIKSTVATSSNTYNISESLVPNTTLTVDVFATLKTTLGTGQTVIPTLAISGTTANSATTVSVSAVTGQTITVNTGSISAAFVNDSTLATKLQVGNTMPKVASFRFTALNDTFTVTDIAVKVGSNNAAGAIRDITLKSTGMTDKIISLNGLIATSTGMSIVVPANDTTGKIVDVYLNLNDVGNNAATSSANVTVTLEGFISNSSTGTRAETNTDQTTNAQYVFKSIPTITNVSLPSTVLSAGTKTLSKVQISADAAGQINWKKLVWTITKTTGVTIGATSTMQVVDSTGNVIAGTFATTTGAIPSTLDLFGPATSGTLSFVADNEQQITTSETYSLKGTVGGTMTAGNSIATSIANPTTAIATPNAYTAIAGADGAQTPSFVWSDRSSLSHSTLTADWVNDYKVKNLPTDSQTLSI